MKAAALAPGDPVQSFAAPVAPLAVIAALELEARTVRLAGGRSSPLVYVSGPGPVRARAAARAAVAAGARALLSWGIAGSLTAARDCGTVMLPGRVISSRGSFETDAGWRRRIVDLASPAFAIGEEPLCTVEHVVTDPREKAEIALRTGAAAVDMESAAVLEAAGEAGLPGLVVRVIADGSRDALPRSVESLVTAEGRTRYRGLWSLVAAPADLRLLFALARRSRRARDVLRRLAGMLAEASR